MTAIRILCDEQGMAVAPRRITLSTVGLVPAMERLAQEPIMPNLAVSLHATTDAQRDRLVPINRKYPLEALIDACKRFPLQAPAAASRSSTCCSTASTTRRRTRGGSCAC